MTDPRYYQDEQGATRSQERVVDGGTSRPLPRPRQPGESKMDAIARLACVAPPLSNGELAALVGSTVESAARMRSRIKLDAAAEEARRVAAINDYWRARGLEVHARVVQENGFASTQSDTRNGWPKWRRAGARA